jgi:ligand-binding sensor domain-containing protein
MLGTWKGVSVMYNNYKGQYLTNPDIHGIINDAHIRHIIQDRKGNYWLSSKNKGLLCLYGNVHNPASLQIKVYNRTIDSSRQIMEVYRTIEDYNGHIWVCSDAGLMLYDCDSDGFMVMNERLGIPYDIRSIETDEENRLWLSSPHAIIRLSLTKQFEVTSMRLFTRKDGLDNYSLGKSLSSASSTGRLCFAGYASYTTIED